MNNDNSFDAFTYHILNNIDPKVRSSLSSMQLSAIKNAIRAGQLQKKHAVNIRGVISLFFARYYFVFLMGRDLRVSTQEIEAERREKAAALGNLIFLIFLLSPFILLIIISLYVLKSIIGIDIFPGKHMGGIFGL